MTNKRKLELTLCGTLPYVLKVSVKRKIYPIWEQLKKWNVKNFYDYFKSKSYEVKPILFSMDRLTEPVLEGGLIPIVELEKEYSGFYFAFTDNQLLVKRKNSNIYFDIDHTNQIIEQLKEWHFNVYDLPKEVYIEKQSS